MWAGRPENLKIRSEQLSSLLPGGLIVSFTLNLKIWAPGHLGVLINKVFSFYAKTNEIEVTKKRVGYTADTKESKKYGCVCTYCHIDDLPWYKCVIFLRNNHNFDIPAVVNALSKRHRDDQEKVHGSRTDNENNMTHDFPSHYMTQSTTLANYCLCTCCHKTDIPRSQCIIFQESKYNFGNAVVLEALSNRFSITTFKEYICKKCDKHLLAEKMPMNSVTSWTRLTSHKPQQKCIHCNSVPTNS